MLSRFRIRKPARRARRSGRAGVAALAAWYLLLSSYALPIVLDVSRPAAAPAPAVGFACAGHDCGCDSEEACRSRCCCARPTDPGTAPVPSKVDPESGRRPVSVLSSLRCRGLDPDAAQTGLMLGPHLPAGLAAGPPAVVTERVRPAHASHSPLVLAHPSDKVPIPALA